MKKIITIIIILTLCFSLTLTMGATGLAKHEADKQEYLVQFNESVNLGLLRAFNIRDTDLLHTYKLLPVTLVNMSTEQALHLAKNPHIKNIEPNADVQALGQSVPWGVSHVQGTEGHTEGFTGQGVKVAILDTGIDRSHEDLSSNVIGGYSVFTDDANKDPFYDGSSHGTHVAGTVVALNNTLGVLGIAYSAELYSVKVLNNDGSGSYAGIAQGIEWAVENKMDIINMSLGGSQSSSILEQWCQIAYDSGILVIAAAGNNGRRNGQGDTVGYPAKYDSVIAVAAIDQSNNRASFSSHGPAVELSAPGVEILSTTPGNLYSSYNGTSMASPHVAGVAALVWQAKPELTNSKLRQLLNDSALQLGASNHYGYGLVQALTAIQSTPSNDDSSDPDPDKPKKPGNGKAPNR